MGEEILKLEKNFFDITYINNEEYLNKIIHDNFLECENLELFLIKKIQLIFC